MNQAKKLLFYLALNIVVSFVTVIGAHYLWERTQLKDLLLDTESQTGAPAEVDSEGENSQDLLIEIGEVGGIGNLATEYIRLERPDSSPDDTVSLQGWHLVDEDNNDFVILEQSGLPSLELVTVTVDVPLAVTSGGLVGVNCTAAVVVAVEVGCI